MNMVPIVKMQNVPLGNDCQFYTCNQHSSPDSLTKEVVCQVIQVKSVFLVSAPHVFPLCQELAKEFYRVQRNETIGLRKDRQCQGKKAGHRRRQAFALAAEHEVLAGGGQCTGDVGWWGPESRALFRSYPLKKVQTIPALPAYSDLTLPHPLKEPI